MSLNFDTESHCPTVTVNKAIYRFTVRVVLADFTMLRSYQVRGLLLVVRVQLALFFMSLEIFIQLIQPITFCQRRL